MANSTPRDLGRDRLFAPNILQYGSLSALREAGPGLLSLSAVQRSVLVAVLHDEAGDSLHKRLLLEALSEIEADAAIRRVRNLHAT